MTAEAGTFYTQLFSLITIIAVAVGGWYSFREYRSNFALQLKAAQSQALQPFLTKQIDLCIELSEAAATLALSTDEATRQQASVTLNALSLGPLKVVERKTGDSIEPAVTEFKTCLEGKCPKLVSLASQIAENCRDEVAISGEINLYRGRRTPTSTAK